MNFFRSLRIGLFVFGGIYLLTMGVIYFLQDRLTFQAKPWPEKQQLNVSIPYHEVWLPLADGQCVHGLHFTVADSAKGVVLYFHGNRGNLIRWSQYAQHFLRLGYNCLMVDYPGYGKSQGKPNEESFYQTAEKAYHWLLTAYQPHDIVLYGRSIGSGPASYLGSKVKAQQLILETPFASFPDLYRHHQVLKWFPMIKAQVNFPVLQYLASTDLPTSIFMGTEDPVVPNASTLKLQPFVHPTEHFFIIQGGKHNDLADFDAYHQGLRAVLK